ncbi:MAG: hypothetical protein LBF12_00885 [Christensenellaceae bacterium]|jgi:mRNA-degrading endonuclease RelE of RelBE toxin-antitoxin system|nr:hypothetical protein [Christensenellaceae bacterium]
MYKIVYENSANKQIEKLHPDFEKQILPFINEKLANASSYAIRDFKLLKGEKGKARYRIDKYRIIITIKGNVIIVLNAEGSGCAYQGSLLMKFVLKKRVHDGYKKPHTKCLYMLF